MPSAKRPRSRNPKNDEKFKDLGRDSFEKGHKFEDKVVALLRLMGMDVKPRENYGCRETDFVASEQHRFSELWYVGECKDYNRKVGVEEVAQLYARLTAFQNDKQRNATGLLVVANETGIGDEARGHARSLKQIELLTYRELQDRVVDLRGYNERLIRDLEAEGRHDAPNAFMESRYIPLRVKPDQADLPIQSLDGYAASFLEDAGARSLTILGDYGTGKTWFSKQLALALARKYQESPASARQPILINLREVAQEITLQSALGKHFQTTLQHQVDTQALLHLASEGRYIFILDGFDEMVAKIAQQYAVQNFRELMQSAHGESKLILTCRTHYFRSQRDVDDLLSTGKHLESGSATELYRDLSQSGGNRLGYLAYFEPEQAREYIDQVCGESASVIHKLLENQPRLTELSTRPVLLDMIARSAPYLAERGDRAAPLTVANLYQTYTESWFDQQRKKGMVSNVEPFWRQLLEELAAELWGRPGNEMPYQQLSSLVQRVAADYVGGPNEGALAELETRNALFLTRNAAGAYRFSHRSFLEFFLACGLRKNLNEPSKLRRALSIDLLSPPVMEFLGELAGNNSVAAAAANILAESYMAKTSENALMMWVQAGAPPRLRPRQLKLAGAELSGLVLTGIDLSNAQLANARLTQTSLLKSDLRNANLDGCDLSGAILDYSRIDGASFAGTRLDFASLWGAEGQAAAWSPVSEVGLTMSRPSQNIASGLRPQVLVPPPRQLVVAISISPDGLLLAAATGTTVRIYDLITGQLRRTLEGHAASALSVAFAPDGRTLASGSDDNTVKLWDLESEELPRTLEGHAGSVRSVAFAPDGRTLASGSDDNTLKLWDSESGQLGRTLEGHAGSVRSVAFARGGHTLASASDDTTVKLWDSESGELRRTLEGHVDWVRSVAFAPDGRTLASGSDDKTLKLWDSESGQLGRTLEGHDGPVLSVAFTADGRTLASGSVDKTVKLWELESGQLGRTLEGHATWVLSVAFAPDGRTLASGSDDRTVKLWDSESGQLRRTLEGQAGSVWSVAFAPDSGTLASGSDDLAVKLWDSESGQLLRTLEGHASSVFSVAFAPDGRTLASGSVDKTVKLWDSESGELRRTLEGQADWVRSVAFAPDGRTLASGSSDNTVKLWDSESGELRRTLEGQVGYVWSVAFSPDGRTLASGSTDQTVKLWDSESGQLRRTLEGHASPVWSVAFSPGGRSVASGSSDNTVKQWDSESGELWRTLEGHAGTVGSVAFAPDGRTLASGSIDNTVKLWDSESGQLRRTLEGHLDWVRSVAFAPDGRTLASGSSDNTVKLWDVPTGELLLTLLSMPEGGYLAIAPDGRFDGDTQGLAQARIGYGLAIYPVEAFPELRSPGLTPRRNS